MVTGSASRVPVAEDFSRAGLLPFEPPSPPRAGRAGIDGCGLSPSGQDAEGGAQSRQYSPRLPSVPQRSAVAHDRRPGSGTEPDGARGPGPASAEGAAPGHLTEGGPGLHGDTSPAPPLHRDRKTRSRKIARSQVTEGASSPHPTSTGLSESPRCPSALAGPCAQLRSGLRAGISTGHLNRVRPQRGRLDLPRGSFEIARAKTNPPGSFQTLRRGESAGRTGERRRVSLFEWDVVCVKLPFLWVTRACAAMAPTRGFHFSSCVGVAELSSRQRRGRGAAVEENENQTGFLLEIWESRQPHQIPSGSPPHDPDSPARFSPFRLLSLFLSSVGPFEIIHPFRGVRRQ
ncbi:hypothetical protein chiPu_0025246 [Chiloscyllium punctatum]|uniref:Uncharacterized protein n=1 Tax=Chiloscyllium punctatum TaxID=137246 RepID=A0A401TEI3_CHIPU|nr:hypothetical protein [Chiloscyllium punctatum]